MFDVPASTVKAIAVWSSATAGAGSLLAWSPANASTRRAFNVNAGELAGNTIDSSAHGLAIGDSLLMWTTIGAALPGGLAEDTQYFVIAGSFATDVITVSTTSGGTVVDITTIGDGDLQKFIPEVFAAQGTYSVSAYSISLPG